MPNYLYSNIIYNRKKRSQTTRTTKAKQNEIVPGVYYTSDELNEEEFIKIML